MNKKIILIFTVLFFAMLTKVNAGEVSQHNDLEIINGVPVDAAHPLAASVVGLVFKYNNGMWLQSCTGSVLTSKLILTAAHCVKGRDPKTITINFSQNTVTYAQQSNPATRIDDLGKHFTVRMAKALITHPKYDGSGAHDLALISLTDLAPLSAKPVHLLPPELVDQAQNKTAFEGQTQPVILMGFGMIKENPRTETSVLRETTVPATFEKNLVITDQTGGSGGCNGDSGGPAFMNYKGHVYQVGVTHGPHAPSQTCHETGEWVNPALDIEFLADAAKKLAKKHSGF